MSEIAIGAICLACSLVLIQTGMNIGVALMLLSFVGVWAIKGLVIAGKLLASSVATSIASDAYAVIPLFVLMGLFVSATKIGRDTFDVAALLLRRLRGGLGIATVAANAVFAACTGTTIASASVFTKVAVPEMIRHGHTPQFSVGVVAGSSVLGMLIPPSILMIIFGVIANVSIADLFTSGILPGILLAVAFCITILLLSHFRQGFVANDPKALSGEYAGPLEGASAWIVAAKFLPIVILVGTVLGGIYGGFFTPTEAGGAGALAAFLIALARRELTLKIFWAVALETGRVTAAICFLLMAAALYSQMLTLSGLPYAAGQWLQNAELGFIPVLLGYLIVVILLGCFLDSVSIMLIVLPFVIPVFDSFGVNLVWLGLITIIAIEIGLLTPPLGIAIFVVKANLEDQRISAWDIFKGTTPMTLTMVMVLILCVLFPKLVLVLVGQNWSWW
ncbi:MAG: TRAP transporter large permease subunit [Rhizobiales bacterium]|nr:TRAP transporter large permease subunit [Hyphomicrobiales bacterium]